MVKIVVLIGKPKAPLIYLTNEIHEQYKIDLLVIENPKNSTQKKPSLSFLEKLMRFSRNNFGKNKNSSFSFLEKVLRFTLLKLGRRRKEEKRRLQNRENERYFNDLFKGKHLKINIDIKTLIVENINSKKTEDSIRKINPNLIIDHGTTLLRENIINLSDLSLNLHWGLSPYYRGVDCTKRALFNWDINNIGVTVHKLSKNIDGGDILGQARVKIKPQDNESTITAQMTYLGTEILKTAIEVTRQGNTVEFKKQKFEEGFLFKINHMNLNLENYINDLDERMINKMITKPSRGKVPIVELDSMESKNKI